MFRQNQGNLDIRELLENSSVIAVLGCSDSTSRISYRVGKYMLSNGYEIYPVNPYHSKALGSECYDTLFDIPENIKVDIVDIFRNSKFTEQMVDQIIAWSDKRAQKPVIWTQLGVTSDIAQKKAEKAGFKYVVNRCLMADHSRLL